MSDFAQLHLHFTDHVQWCYEVIRPLVLFEDRTVSQRAEETHLHPDTVRRFTRRFQQQGMLGLFPDTVAVVRPSRGRQVPEAILQEIARLKGLYDGFQYRELARIIHCQCHYQIDDKTIKKLWHQSPVPVQRALPFESYHSPTHRYDARLQVITLYYQGWNKSSISGFLQVSRPTVAPQLTVVMSTTAPRDAEAHARDARAASEESIATAARETSRVPGRSRHDL